ncbi:MAG: LamG-like jellyroll fold domain-containing protein [Kiritimatiellia bacterium]|nr:LamG-like jellyroll fold domain-containing protein [Kiritimatiellia bacterium]
MKFITGIFPLLFGVLVCGAQDISPSADVSQVKEETGQATSAAPVTTQTSASNSPAIQINADLTGTVTLASGETNAPPAPVKDPAQCVIAHFSFDSNLQPDVGGGTTIPVTFKRESAAYLEGVPVSDNSPRFVEGRSGRAVLLESAYANLFSIAQSDATDTTAFVPIQGTVLSISPDQPWQGKEALAIATKGENSEEGFSAETLVEKALYTKESAPFIAPASYLASLYLKGQGNVKLTLKDVESGACGEPVYVELSDNWQRFSCTFGYSFGRTNIGANHEADWKNSIPPDANLSSHLQLICTTIDSLKLNFFADGLQLEKRLALSGKNIELSPHSWVLGAFQTAQEQLTIDVKNDYFKTWRKNGSIAFWFRPLWDARDGSWEFILQVAPHQFSLSHSGRKIIFSPAGVSFTPYDWGNDWHHIVITWNETGKRALYMDGMDYPSTSGTLRPLKNPSSIMAGDFARNLSPNGTFDDLTLYNITINSEQAKALQSAEPAAKPAELNELKSPDQSPAPVSTVSTGQPAVSVAQDDDAEKE